MTENSFVSVHKLKDCSQCRNQHICRQLIYKGRRKKPSSQRQKLKKQKQGKSHLFILSDLREDAVKARCKETLKMVHIYQNTLWWLLTTDHFLFNFTNLKKLKNFMCSQRSANICDILCSWKSFITHHKHKSSRTQITSHVHRHSASIVDHKTCIAL